MSNARVFLLVVHLSCCVGLLSCGEANEFIEPPPPKVTVATPLVQDVTTFAVFSGRTSAIEAVDIRARVQGYLKEVHFDDGDRVDAEALLFTIEPESYQAALDGAKADLQAAEAVTEQAKWRFNQVEALFKKKSANEQELVEAETGWRRAEAAVLAAKAQLDQAKLNLAYTEVRAPIAGRLSRSLIDKGNLVGQGEPTLLTTIAHDDQIHVYFNVSERDLLRYIAQRPEGTPQTRRSFTVLLELADGSPYGHEGRTNFADNRVDQATGTLQIRAVFPNPEFRLWPGLFVRVRVPETTKSAMLIPAAAVQRDMLGYYVMTIDSDNVVSRANIEVGGSVLGHRIVTEGLEPSTRVVTAGVQRSRPGSKVAPEQQELKPLDVRIMPGIHDAPEPPGDGEAVAPIESDDAGDPAADAEG